MSSIELQTLTLRLFCTGNYYYYDESQLFGVLFSTGRISRAAILEVCSVEPRSFLLHLLDNISFIRILLIT